MFIAREHERAVLQRLYERPGFQFPVLYGRRRVGKTYLMAEFTKKLPTIFFTATEGSAETNLAVLSRELYAFKHPDVSMDSAPVFADFASAFEEVFRMGRTRRLVFVIDEYPYLAQSDKSVSSILQLLIDRNKDSSQLFLMLCGSSLSFMREQVLGERSPLYGRRTAQIELKPLDFFDARLFFPEVAPEDAACYYGMVGGIPLYLQQIDECLSLRDNIERALLDPSSILFEEPLNLLKQEVQKAPLYNTIMGAVARGKTENKTIAASAGVTSPELTYYLKELQRIELLNREAPIVNSGRRAVYCLSDNLFRFWYRFVGPQRSALERHMTRRALGEVEHHLAEYMGPIFEQICNQWLWRQNVSGLLPVEFDRLGRWWGNNPERHREEEIDLVGVAGNAVTLIGECKWRNETVSASIASILSERGRLVGATDKTHDFLFSKSGFSGGCQELEGDRLSLIDLEDMVALAR